VHLFPIWAVVAVVVIAVLVFGGVILSDLRTRRTKKDEDKT
jgi:hypothetical protein